MKREAEENWASERVENALLRERINDVAAEVARLASTLEGPNSPIDAILAAETVRDRAHLATAASNGEPEFSEAPSTNGNLADRIRALQSHASRVPQSDKRPPATSQRASLDTSWRHSLYRAAVTTGRLAQRESVPFTRERS